MGSRYEVAGRSAATAGTINHAGAALWNPSTTKGIKIMEVWWFKRVATADNIALQRITTKGTPASDVTPDIDNDLDKAVAPPSGFVLSLGAYSAQPTLSTPPLRQLNLPATVASGFKWVWDKGLFIPQSTGVAFVSPDAVVLQPGDVTFIVDD